MESIWVTIIIYFCYLIALMVVLGISYIMYFSHKRMRELANELGCSYKFSNWSAANNKMFIVTGSYRSHNIEIYGLPIESGSMAMPNYLIIKIDGKEVSNDNFGNAEVNNNRIKIYLDKYLDNLI